MAPLTLLLAAGTGSDRASSASEKKTRGYNRSGTGADTSIVGEAGEWALTPHLLLTQDS